MTFFQNAQGSISRNQAFIDPSNHILAKNYVTLKTKLKYPSVDLLTTLIVVQFPMFFRSIYSFIRVHKL